MMAHLSRILPFPVFILLMLLCGIPQARAAEVTGRHTQIRVLLDKPGSDGAVSGVLQFAMEPGWHTYWRSPGDAGAPMTISVTGSTGVKSARFDWPAPARIVEEAFNLETYGYTGRVSFPLHLVLTRPDAPATLNLAVNYTICSDVCVPDTVTLQAAIDAKEDAGAASAVAEAAKTVAMPNGSSGLEITDAVVSVHGDKKTLAVKASNPGGFVKPDIFVEGADSVRFPKPTVALSEGNAHAVLTFAPEETFPDRKWTAEQLTLTLVDNGRAVEKRPGAAVAGISTTPAAGVPERGFPMLLLFAFIGGLILNVMPCVLPVLSIKILSAFKHGGGNARDVRQSFLISAAGIVCSFLLLAGLTLSLKAAGMAVGWGFHFQEPNFLIALIIILTLFAANLWGWFEIGLPGWLGGRAVRASAWHSKMGDFAAGMFATLLATPCSAPFLGTAVGFALSHGAREILAIFTCMGIGLATPYLIVAAYPRLATMLPRPGKWMVTFKHFLGVLLGITGLWLIWVLAAQIGAFGAWMVLGLCALMLVKLKVLARHERYGTLLAPAIILLAVLAFLAPRQMGKELAGTAGAHDGFWQAFDEAAIPEMVAQGRVVMVDVTADWCLTCKANKLLVLNTQTSREFLQAHHVAAMQADWTNRDARIAAYLQKFGRYGIPFNVVYGPGAPEGIVLPELLKIRALEDAVSKAEKK